MAESYKRIESVKKAFKILDFLSNEKEPIPGRQIAEAAEMEYGILMCHLVTLEDLGIVQKTSHGYYLGSQLALYWAKRKALLAEKQKRVLRDLADLG